MPVAYSNIGDALFAQYEQRRAAEAANQQLMTTLFAPMKFKQQEAEKDRALDWRQHEDRYVKEEEARTAERKLTFDKVEQEALNAQELANIKGWWDYQKEVYKTEHKPPPKEDKFSPSELTQAGGVGLKLGDMTSAQEQDLEKFNQINYFMGLSSEGKGKIGDDVPILGDLKSRWESGKHGFNPFVPDEQLGFNDYAGVLGLTSQQASEALLAKGKQDASVEFASAVPSLTGIPEDVGGQVISEALGGITGFEEQPFPIPTTGDAPRFETAEQRINAMVEGLFNQGQQPTQPEPVPDALQTMSRAEKINLYLGE